MGWEKRFVRAIDRLGDLFVGLSVRSAGIAIRLKETAARERLGLETWPSPGGFMEALEQIEKAEEMEPQLREYLKRLDEEKKRVRELTASRIIYGIRRRAGALWIFQSKSPPVPVKVSTSFHAPALACSSLPQSGYFALLSSHGFPFHLNPISIVHQPVQDCIRYRGLPYQLMPNLYRYLAYDHR